jgi:hypothetical protein
MTSITLQNFIATHLPSPKNTRASAETIASYKGVLPDSLLELWQATGFGFYGSGLIQVINPDDYKEILWAWLLRDEDMTRLPIALSAFGDIFYYRNLNDEENEDDDETHEDVSFLDPHSPESGCTVWSLNDFFNEWLCDSEVIENFLSKDMLKAATEKHGALEENQIFTFVPALKLGGRRSAEHTDRCDAECQLDFLLQLVQDA